MFFRNLEGETPRTSLAPGAALHKRKSFSKLRRSFQKMKKDSMGDSSTSEWYTDIELKKIEHVEKVNTSSKATQYFYSIQLH